MQTKRTARSINLGTKTLLGLLGLLRVYLNLIHVEGILKPEFTEGVLKSDSRLGYTEILWIYRRYTEIWIHRGYTEIWPRVYWNMNSGYTEIWPRVYWNMNSGYTEIWPRVDWNMNSRYTEIWPRVYWNMNSSCIEGSWIATRTYWNHKNLQNIEKNVKKFLAGGYTEIPKLSSMSCQVLQPHGCNVDFQFPMP